jgi:hypothetical protein
MYTPQRETTTETPGEVFHVETKMLAHLLHLFAECCEAAGSDPHVRNHLNGIVNLRSRDKMARVHGECTQAMVTVRQTSKDRDRRSR